MQHRIAITRRPKHLAGLLPRAVAAFLMAVWLVPATSPVAAAETWTPRASGTTSDLRGVAVVDQSTAWVVGSAGAVLKTTDGGANWVPQLSGTTDDLMGVAAVDAQTAWVVGANSTILKTSNGGTDWSRQAVYPDAFLSSVSAVDASTAWVVDGAGGAILKTADGGETWSTQYQYGYPLSGIAAANADTAWAVGQSGAVLATTDGGQTWNPGWCNDCHYLSGVAAVDGNTLWTAGRVGVIGRSSDGGLGWEVQNSGVQGDLNAVATTDPETAWVVGVNATILKTTDGGRTWTVQSSGGPSLRGVAAAGPGAVYAVGDGGIILQTGAAPAQPAAATPEPTPVVPSNPQPMGQPGTWNGTVTIVQKFTWQGSASAGIETYTGDATAQLTTRINFKDSVASADTTFSGSTKYVTNGSGSPCNYEITRDESGSAGLASPLEVSTSRPAPNQLVLNIVVLPDPVGTVDVQEVTRNYGGESCFTEVDRRQYAFGSNNTFLEGFYRELQFELEHGALQTSLAVTPDGPGGTPVYTASESVSKDVPMSRPVGMPNIIAPGHQTMSVTWALQAAGSN